MARYAAVDIGSNSVRMLAADMVAGELQVLAQDRQVTRLGESVFRDGRISKEALDFLCANLERMAAAYSKLGVAAVRAVATSAVRDTSNQDEFLQRTSAAVGADVEIISGTEEARLIHLGVEALWPRPKERALLIDVGGGSAELIISQNGQMIDAVSRPLGAVRLTSMFLKSDPARPDELHRMMSYIDEKLLPFLHLHGSEKFQRTIVTSASAGAIVAAANQIARAKRDEADRVPARLGQVRDLFQQISRLAVAERRKITGIGPRRAEIIVAGAAVFLRAMESFELKSIYYCTAGVREGIVADLAARGVGREMTQLSPEQRTVVEGLAMKYQANINHARHVARLASRLFQVFEPVHKLQPEAGRLLESAAYLHDIGHFVSNTNHHKHSAYLIENSDLPGYTDRERLALAALSRFHRKSLPQARHSHYQALESEAKKRVLRLTPLLRIADSLDRGHEQKVDDVSLSTRDGSYTLVVKSQDEVDLEVWAANQVSQSFREIYGIPLSVQRAKANGI